MMCPHNDISDEWAAVLGFLGALLAVLAPVVVFGGLALLFIGVLGGGD